MMKYNFENKRVWITGASSGIGLALAKELHAHGAYIAATSRNKKKLQAAFHNQTKTEFFPGDVTISRVNKDIVKQIKKQLGGIDCVILNAGNAEYIDIKHFSEEPFERMIETNYLSIVKGIAAALPVLRKSQHPYLVGMSSSVAWHGLPKGQAYSASKAAIRNLFQGLRIELAAEAISTSWICPGFVKTPLTDKNTFPMPLLISPEKAASIICKKLSQQKAEIHFPKSFTYLLRLISFLPAHIASKLLSRTAQQ